MLELRSNFDGIGEVKGYQFNQIEASQKGFIYSVICKETGKVHYEVFKRKEHKKSDRVSYPTSKAFGKWAWTASNLQKAQHRLKNFEKDLQE